MKAVIFDMDGVLIDSEPLHFKGSRKVLKKFGNELTWDVYKKCIGTTMKKSMEIYIKEFKLDVPVDELMKLCDNAFVEEVKKNCVAKEGAYSLLKCLVGRITIALASSANESQIDMILKGLKIKQYFSIIISGEHFEESKPDPRVYIETAKNLQVNPRECIVIEDSEAGLHAAKDAGMKCVIVRTAYTKDSDMSRADHIIDSLNDFNLGWIK